MAIVKCVECGGAVSDWAKTCPGCGAANLCGQTSVARRTHVAVNNSASYDIYAPTRSHTDIGKLDAGWT